MSTAHRKRACFKVGDWVSFVYGVRPVWAQVIEDRGLLGVGRTRLYRIRFGDDPSAGESGEPVEFEVPEDDLTLARPDHEAVIEYLEQGGLLAILQSNLGGGRSQPRVWLTFDRGGRIVHTFDKTRGVLGGETVPFFALLEYRVFTPKAHQVIDFLASFGLNRAEAEQVVAAVGTSS
jgi:hypothetical protein